MKYFSNKELEKKIHQGSGVQSVSLAESTSNGKIGLVVDNVRQSPDVNVHGLKSMAYAETSDYVPKTRTVNTKELSNDVTLTLDDIADGNTRGLGAYVLKSGDTMTGNLTVQNIVIGNSNEINSLANNALYLNYRSNEAVILAVGGGNVGVGGSPSHKLHVFGDVYSTGDQIVASDKTLKKNFQDLKYTVEDIAKAPAVSFDWKDKEGHSFGSIAQYWKPICPEMVHGVEGQYSLAYAQGAFTNTILLAREVVELRKRIKELEAKLP